MLILAKAVLAFMIGFILSIIFGVVLIPLLKKMNIKQTVSVFLSKHKEKEGTPTMGGLIFIIPTIISVVILLLWNKLEMTYNLGIVMFVFLAYALLGFIDDYLIIKRHNNIGLSETQKLIGQIFIALIFFLLFIMGGRDPVLEIYTLGISINLGWFYWLLILLMLVATTNAVNLTDGLDGLAGGLSAIGFVAFGLMAWGSSWIVGYQDIGIFCFILVGCIMGFLVYNTHPAKVFMGDTGSLTLGATLATIAILTSHELSLAVIGGVFVIETLTVIIQITSVVIFKRKVFLMTPIHHHFERLGWSETDIVKLFWIVGFILCLMALIYGVWL